LVELVFLKSDSSDVAGLIFGVFAPRFWVRRPLLMNAQNTIVLHFSKHSALSD